jgi:hypothetical protein
MTLFVLMIIACVLCLFLLVMTLVNLRINTPPTAGELRALPDDQQPLICVCIPARNEEANLEACVRSVLASTHRNVAVYVYNDHSTDATGTILETLMAEDSRVRATPVVPLEPGWNGKQFGCHQMGQHAQGEYLLFTDADVRFAPDCLSATLNRARALSVDLLSTFPMQRTHTLSEALVIPLIHFILLSYLPMSRMRNTTDPAASAGCGQFLFVRREAYISAGGHAPFKASMHDGIKLPRTMRKAGFRTDLFDATALVSCRMYRGFVQTWRGFSKNAYEGLGSIPLLVFVTIVHAIAYLMPWCVLILAAIASASPSAASSPAILRAASDPATVGLAVLACFVAIAHRCLLALRFQQRFSGAFLHPIGIMLMTAIQWNSLYLHLTNQRAWKGRGGNAPAPTISA